MPVAEDAATVGTAGHRGQPKGAAPSRPATTPERVHSYDLFRGFLLTAMFVWHVILNLTNMWWLHADFFRWISMGFVMFLGVGLARFLQGRTRKKLVLALKLLVTFYVLNTHNYLQPDFDPLVLLTGSQLHLSFEVLFPMALVIFITIPLDRLQRHCWLWAGLLYAVIVAANLLGLHVYNLQIVLYGLFAYFLARRLDLDGLVRESPAWLLPFAVIICAIPLLVRQAGYYLDFLFVAYVLALYFLYARLIRTNRVLEFIGRNSFVMYVGQIVLVKLLSYVIHGQA